MAKRGKPAAAWAKSGLLAYGSWSQMIQRCHNPNNPRYKDYGGRGITVCERWRKFANFLADMGDRPPMLQLERVNNDGNYERENCTWADRKTQMNNRRNSHPEPKPRMSKQDAALLARTAAAAAKRKATIEKLKVARPLWNRPSSEISTDEIASRSGLSIKTLYAELGRRSAAQNRRRRK